MPFCARSPPGELGSTQRHSPHCCTLCSSECSLRRRPGSLSAHNTREETQAPRGKTTCPRLLHVPGSAANLRASVQASARSRPRSPLGFDPPESWGMEAAACGAPAPPSLTPAPRGKCFLVLPTLGAVPPCTLGITSRPPREAGGFPGGAPPLSQPCRREVFFCAASFSRVSSRPGCVYPGVYSRVCVTAWLSVSSSV